ncbi:hypothetical protein JMUB6875_15200 [Nocardia sp. JMUB6875]|uniref:hypothetical protein n=1 Tax=Nocardia sp. JMUB6875 TaxID=3158170 RepID=UPI0032E69EF4
MPKADGDITPGHQTLPYIGHRIGKATVHQPISRYVLIVDRWADVSGPGWRPPDDYAPRSPATVPAEEMVWTLVDPGYPATAIHHTTPECDVLAVDLALARKCDGNRNIVQRKYKNIRARATPLACPVCDRLRTDESLLRNCQVSTHEGIRHGSVLRWRETSDKRWFAIVRYRDAYGDLIVGVLPSERLEPDPE